MIWYINKNDINRFVDFNICIRENMGGGRKIPEPEIESLEEYEEIIHEPAPRSNLIPTLEYTEFIDINNCKIKFEILIYTSHQRTG